MGDIDFALNFQGYARCATGVAWKSLEKRRRKKIPKIMLVYTFI